MSQDNAKKFLKKVASDPATLKSVKSSLQGSVVHAGHSDGFQFTPEELKEKSKQKRAKSIGELQLQRRREKEQKLMAEKQQKEIELQEYQADPTAFLLSLHKQREAVVASREERLRAESAPAADG